MGKTVDDARRPDAEASGHTGIAALLRDHAAEVAHLPARPDRREVAV